MQCHLSWLATRSHARSQKIITAFFSLLAIGLGFLRVQGQAFDSPDPKFWTPNGPINAIVATSNTVYLGGDFTYIGPRTGPAAVFDSSTGKLLSGPSQIGGQVKAVVSDGAGGWFIGGTFTNVGGFAFTNLAHLNGNLAVDPDFNAKLSGTTVNALLFNAGRLYIAGSFTRVGGVANSGGLFGLNASDASLVWNPTLSGTVNALALDASGLLYAGGNFFSVGASNVSNLASISTNITALATGWNPAPDSQVLALSISGTNIYVGGQFANIGTKARNRLAAINLTNGVAGTWNPNPNGIVRALWVTATNAYVGGDFTTISVSNRRGLASIGLTGTGTAQPLDLQIQSATTTSLVRSILLAGNALYVGGQFTNFLATQCALLASVDITTGLPTNAPVGTDLNGAFGAAFGANALAASGNKVLVVGDFQSLGGVVRRSAAALSIAGGGALPWAPNFQTPVLTLAAGTNAIYAGGAFTNLNGTNYQGLVALDPQTGDALPDFSFNGTNSFSPVIINSLQFSSGGLYVGGAFTTVSGQARRLLALVNPLTGALVTAFDAKLGGGFAGVNSMALSGSTLYVAGDFSSVNSVAQSRLAALSAADGTAFSWLPNPNQLVTVLAASADTLYVGGSFTLINGIALKNFAAFSLADRSLIPIDAALPTFAGGVTALGATTSVIYLSGSFSAAGGELRTNAASLSPLDGSALAWGTPFDVGPAVITLTDQYAYMGGQFRFVGGQAAAFFAAFSRAPQFFSTALVDPATLQFSTTTGDGTDVVIQWTSDLKPAIWSNIATNTSGFPWTFQLPVTGSHGYLRAVAR